MFFSCLDLQIGIFQLHYFRCRYWTWCWLVRNQLFSLGFRCIAIGVTISFFHFSTHVPAVESMGSQWVYKMLLCNLWLYCRLWRFRIWNYEPGWIYMGRDTTEHIKCILVSQVWPNCKIRCFFMLGHANRDLPTALLPLLILDVMLGFGTNCSAYGSDV